jgi:hypothetical protein
VSWARTFARFWWDFVVGDDWRAAGGITLALALTAVLTHVWLSAWWLPPLAVAVVLARSLQHATRQSTADDLRTEVRADKPVPRDRDRRAG